ncbi:MAG: endonuclease/exonuclease/phosphatase family protein [Aestuariivirga sp.]|uniref:endonuclease/exonuclease/phosphatase family protein n=1 Tax=Aestuariivirga sp. TaxID=2650926 RepID=UPI0025C3F4E9|nr:endonuclease/exonuclease/phosphatase family protein [Aestuariivirga sp.]MCA3561792.1 endonuclease/exonuclease/phosphatase family protein [Aestuariivirga sp.]
MLLVTYNIQWGMGRDRRIDLSRIAGTVAAADVIALQEVERNWREQDWPDQAARLAELLPGFDWVYGAGVDLHGGVGRRRQIGNMILSRAPIESTRTLPLPSWPVEGQVNDQQAMTEAVIGELRLYNAHLNYLGEDQRLDQAARLLAMIAEAPQRGGPVTAPGRTALGPDDEWIVLPDGRFPTMPEPAILLGDFNCVPGSPAYRSIRAEGFADALELAGLAPHEGVTFPGHAPPLRLDHIFLSPALVPRFRHARIDEEAAGSDHKPVWLELA